MVAGDRRGGAPLLTPPAHHTESTAFQRACATGDTARGLGRDRARLPAPPSSPVLSSPALLDAPCADLP
uniref:Uncharacterized protein n=1 Tax=Oryza sativa subsp. japonica TaxID=39947 RepID=Q6EPX7_ORYSJ|nr:hypothetical protein [Oryza sativa Japonica Group]